jgi:chitinase
MNLRITSSSICSLALLIGIAAYCFALPDTPAKEPKSDKVFVGYVFRTPKKINFALYTHLCHAFLVADEDGKLQSGRECPSHSLVTDAHKAGVKVMVSLGGWGWDKQFAAIVSKPEAEDRYLKAVLAVVDEYDYDGIDLDWEYTTQRRKSSALIA